MLVSNICAQQNDIGMINTLGSSLILSSSLNVQTSIADRLLSQSLFENRKVDILDNKYKVWCIGTIIRINKENKYFTVHYDGFSSIYDENISFDNASKIKELHTMTPYHEYETNKNCKPCVYSKYNQCKICAKRYCTKCMLEYIKDNECKDCLNAMNKNKWITKLKKGNKCDVYLYGYQGILSNNQWHNGWHIATICDIQSINSHKMKLSVHFNGFESKYDECIDADTSSKTLCFKLNRLNKYSVHHTYLSNIDDKNVCVAINEWKKCSICQRKCCQKCMPPGIVLDNIGYLCNECGPKQENDRLFEVIKTTLSNQYKDEMQMNIIQIIFNYSLGVTVTCCNEWNCLNEINFSSQFQMELNAQQNKKNKNLKIFQYYIHYKQTININPNVLLFGKKRRIFCEECSQYELGNCIQCNARTEIDGINKTLKCQKCLDFDEKKEKDAIIKRNCQRNKTKRHRHMPQRRRPRGRYIRRKQLLYNCLERYVDHKYSDYDCNNERLSKMKRKWNGFEKVRDITKYLQRKELKKKNLRYFKNVISYNDEYMHPFDDTLLII